MRFVFVIALGLLLAAVVAYTVLGLIRLARLLVRSDIFAVTVTVMVVLVLTATLPRVVLLPSPGSLPSPPESTPSFENVPHTPNPRGPEQEKRNATSVASVASRGPLAEGTATSEAAAEINKDLQAPIAADGRDSAIASAEANAILRDSTQPAQREEERSPGDQPAGAVQYASAKPTTKTLWTKLQPADWVNRQPFYLDNNHTLAWPMVLGPYIEPTQPLSLGELRRRLSGPWFYWLVELAPQRCSPELAAALFRTETPGDRDRPWDRRIRWLPPELWDDLSQRALEAIGAYAREELGVELPGPLPADWIAENFLRDVYWEIVWPRDIPRPVVLDDADSTVANLRDVLGPIQFRVHILLGFDQNSRPALVQYLRQSGIRQRTFRVLVAIGALVGAAGIGYLGIRAERRTTGRVRRLCIWSAVLGVVVMFLVILQAFLTPT